MQTWFIAPSRYYRNSGEHGFNASCPQRGPGLPLQLGLSAGSRDSRGLAQEGAGRAGSTARVPFGVISPRSPGRARLERTVIDLTLDGPLGHGMAYRG